MRVYLKDKVEEISDEFGSTFSVLHRSVLQNILREEELDSLTEVITKHVPGAQIQYIQASTFDESMGVYVIGDTSDADLKLGVEDA